MSRALDKNKNDWRARMFLSMAYYATGATFPAALATPPLTPRAGSIIEGK